MRALNVHRYMLHYARFPLVWTSVRFIACLPNTYRKLTVCTLTTWLALREPGPWTITRLRYTYLAPQSNTITNHSANVWIPMHYPELLQSP